MDAVDGDGGRCPRRASAGDGTRSPPSPSTVSTFPKAGYEPDEDWAEPTAANSARLAPFAATHPPEMTGGAFGIHGRRD